MASTFGAISIGRCSITSSGSSAMARNSAWSPSIELLSGGRQNPVLAILVELRKRWRARSWRRVNAKADALEIAAFTATFAVGSFVADDWRVPTTQHSAN